MLTWLNSPRLLLKAQLDPHNTTWVDLVLKLAKLQRRNLYHQVAALLLLLDLKQLMDKFIKQHSNHQPQPSLR